MLTVLFYFICSIRNLSETTHPTHYIICCSLLTTVWFNMMFCCPHRHYTCNNTGTRHTASCCFLNFLSVHRATHHNMLKLPLHVFHLGGFRRPALTIHIFYFREEKQTHQQYKWHHANHK